MIQVTIEIAVCRWKAEHEVRLREQVLSATVSAVHDAVIAVDGSLLIILMNLSAEQLTGWKSSEALKSTIWTVLDLYAPDGSSLQVNPVTENPPRPIDLLLRTKDGETLNVSMQKLSFDRGDEDKNCTIFILSRGSTHGMVQKV
jgi:PAS domain S-box-containing protein